MTNKQDWEETADVIRAVISSGLLAKETTLEIAEQLAVWHHAQLDVAVASERESAVREALLEVKQAALDTITPGLMLSPSEQSGAYYDQAMAMANKIDTLLEKSKK